MYLLPSRRKKKYSFLKANEAWWTVLVLDLFAIPGVIVANKFKKAITPNGISSASFVIFYLAVALMFVYPNKNAYFTLCFFICSVVDAMDGKLARMRGEASQFGVIVDAIFDMLNHGLGLMLVGLALSIKTGSPYPLVIILPYSIYLGSAHINHITSAVMCFNARPEQKLTVIGSNKTKWQLFCDKRGLRYKIYGDVEIIYVIILLIGVNLQNPSFFLLVGIYPPFILQIWEKLRKVVKYGLPRKT